MDNLLIIYEEDDSRQLLARITFEPGKRNGQACIRNLRITVSDVLGYLTAGMSAAQIVEDFPDLELDDIRAATCYAQHIIDLYHEINH